MNRREAIAALVALPEIARISTAPITASDVIVVECSMRLTVEAAERIREQMTAIWPGRRIVVLDSGMTLKVVAQ